MSVETIGPVAGVVRSVVIGTTVKGEVYARIRLARDPGYFMDFDDPEAWLEMKGTPVLIWFTEQVGEGGLTWRVALDVEEYEGWEAE